jgi:hypothetical protein
MKITWINPAPIVASDGIRTSARPCVRLRSMIPGDELRRRGHDVCQIYSGELNEWINSSQFFDRDIFVFGKAFLDFSPIMKAVHAVGGKVVVDLCDNVFEPPEDALKTVYLAMLPLADTVITSSQSLTNAVAQHFPSTVPVFSVPDAVENERVAPRFEPASDTLRLLWYGFPNNLVCLRQGLLDLRALTQQFDVTLAVVTGWIDDAKAMFPETIDSIGIRRVDWSPKAMRDELARADIVIIPSDNNAARVTKSANRVITGLWVGKLVVAYPLPSYLPFGRFARIGRDLLSGILWAIENKQEIPGRINKGQEFVWDKFSPSVIGDAWESAFKRLMAPD